MQVHFNSIMVQLKLWCGIFLHWEFSIFQFHNGTIKTLKFPMLWLNGSRFQFHNGTIKTNRWWFQTHSRITFQFHNGTIKTTGSIKKINFFEHFNSIMVQLKPIGIYNGNLVFTEVSLRINVYFFVVKMSMYNESIFADLRQHLHLIFIVKG